MESPLKNECIPFYEPGKTITVECTAAVTGKRFLAISADKEGGSFGLSATSDGGNLKVAHGANKAKSIFGVSNRDGKEKEKIGSYGPGFVVPVTAAEAINKDEQVGCGAEGKAVKADAEHPAVAKCLTSCEANKDCMVRIGL